MLSSQFLGLNVHLAVNLLAALVCFAVFWLIFDAWLARRSSAEAMKWFGFLVLMAGFLVSAAMLPGNAGTSVTLSWAAGLLKLFGLAALCIGQFMDPLQKRPDMPETSFAELLGEPEPMPTPATAPLKHPAKPKAKRKAKPSLPAVFFGVSIGLPFLSGLVTLGALGVSVLYWRRATTGLERHLRPVAHAFACLALSELASTVNSATVSQNPLITQLTDTYGTVWWLGQILLAAGALILGRWVWNYLTERLLSQLFMTLIGQAMAIFMVSTVGLTYLMLSDIRTAQLGDLTTASRVLQYAITSRQNEITAQAGTAAAGNTLAQAVTNRSRAAIAAQLQQFYTDHHFSSLVVTDASGVVLWRAQDPERFGDSRSSDSLVRRALVGQAASDVLVTSGVTAPQVSLAAASPVRDGDGQVIGSVTLAQSVSNAFVDGIQSSTGLASTVYGGNVRAATTLVGADGSRALGVTETDTGITAPVLTDGHTYAGTGTMQNREYLVAVSPLLNVNNQPVGMLQAARPASDLLSAANRSLQLTFIAVVGLILLAAYPLYRLASFVERQLR